MPKQLTIEFPSLKHISFEELKKAQTLARLQYLEQENQKLKQIISAFKGWNTRKSK